MQATKRRIVELCEWLFAGGALFVGLMSLVCLGVAIPLILGAKENAKSARPAAYIDQVVKACKLYAMDHNGFYPAKRGSGFATSTGAFNELLTAVELGSEVMFYGGGMRDKRKPPNEDGILVRHENCLIYVSGQSDSTRADSPLVADEMESPGVYGSASPRLRTGRVMVGYCGGRVKLESLSSTEPGAKVLGPPGSGIDNIFQLATVDEKGQPSGGLLAVPVGNVLLP